MLVNHRRALPNSIFIRRKNNPMNLSVFNLVQLALNGILVGGVYALVALGIVVVNKASGVFNFAHGFMMLLGAMIFWQVFTIPPSVGFALVLGIIAGSIVTEGLAYQRAENENAFLQTRLQRWQTQLTDIRFQKKIGAGFVVGMIVYWMLRNIENDILRGALGAVIGSAAMGLAIERVTIRPLLGQPPLSTIVMTLAVALILQGLTAL